MERTLPDLLELKWMLIPFLACLVISLKHVYLGIHVISRKVIFVDLALAQIAAVGATYATTLGYDPHTDSLQVALFSLAFTFVGAVAFSLARMKKEKVPQEAFIGIIYAAASALAILILSKSATGGEELKHMLVGDILLVSPQTVMHVAILYFLLAIFHFVFRKKFLAISLDAEAAEAAGIRVRFWDILFYMSFGIVITRSVSIAGVLLVFSYLVVPAVVAQMWFSSIRQRLFMGWAVALLASTAGILWSFYSDYPTGPAIVLMLSVSLGISGLIYYLRNATSVLKATTSVAGVTAFIVIFLLSLSLFKKDPGSDPKAQLSPVSILLNELKEGEEAHQLDAISHLGEMHDARIVPALTELLSQTSSERVVESIAEALAMQKDPRAASALQEAAKKDFDDFLKLTIARAQLSIDDRAGYSTLLGILESEEAGFARAQAIELLESESGEKFNYDAAKSVEENQTSLTNIEKWIRKKKGK